MANKPGIKFVTVLFLVFIVWLAYSVIMKYAGQDILIKITWFILWASIWFKFSAKK